MSVTVDPFTTGKSASGGPGGDSDGPIVTRISFDGGLTPAAFAARTRMKRVPPPASVAEKLVAVEPVEKFATSTPPLVDPASTTYDVGGLPLAGGVHLSVRVEPNTLAASPCGAPGAPSPAIVAT